MISLDMDTVTTTTLPAKRPPQTPKERHFVREYAKTGNATESAARAYNVSSRASAKSIGSENLSKLDFSGVMEEAGLTDEYLVDILKDGLSLVDDYSTRHQYLKTALMLKNKYPAKQHQVETAVTINDILATLDN